MSDTQPIQPTAPPCPVCTGATDMKKVHREPAHMLIVYKCRSCAVEYPVVAKGEDR